MKETTQPNEAIVWVYNREKKIIYYKEQKSTNKGQLDINFQTISKLSKSFDRFYLIVDLTEASRPTAEIRQHIFKKFALIESTLEHCSLFTEKNVLVNMAATFVMRKTSLRSFSIHKKLKDAEEAIEKHRG